MLDLEKELQSLSEENDIIIPKSLRSRIDETYSQLEEKSKLNLDIVKTLKIASVIIILIIGTNTFAPTFAQEIPLVGPVFKILNDWGVKIKYTDHSVVVKDNYSTENYNVNIEAVDFDGEKILLVYKVQGVNKTTPWPCTLDIEIKLKEGNISSEGSMATGDIKDGAYYGYQQYEVNFEDKTDNVEKINLEITPKALFVGENEEVITNSKKIELVIKNRSIKN